MISDLTMGGDIGDPLPMYVVCSQRREQIVYAKPLALGAWTILFAHVRVSA